MKLKELAYKVCSLYPNWALKHIQKDSEDEDVLLKSNPQVNLEKIVADFVEYYACKRKIFSVDEVTKFIDKMAVWFELRYPNRYFDSLDVDGIMFTENPYLKNEWEEDLGYLNWGDFYNTKVFVNSLSAEESFFLMRSVYENIHLGYFNCRIELSNKGTILKCGRIGSHKYYNKPIGEVLVGMHIKDAYELLKNQPNISLLAIREIENCISNYELNCSLKEGLLDAVMYRIIDRGGRAYGAMRGLKFAQEFKRDISKPIQYISDNNYILLKPIINEYLRLGGSLDLECYTDYFDISDDAELDVIRLGDQLDFMSRAGFYTIEEKNLHQSLVNALAAGVPDDIRMPQAKTVEEQRLERKRRRSENRLKK